MLLIGDKYNTAMGKDLAPEPVKSSLGNYRASSLKAVKEIPGARLVLFPDLVHAPHVKNPLRFQTALVNSLVSLEDD